MLHVYTDVGALVVLALPQQASLFCTGSYSEYLGGQISKSVLDVTVLEIQAWAHSRATSPVSQHIVGLDACTLMTLQKTYIRSSPLPNMFIHAGWCRP